LTLPDEAETSPTPKGAWPESTEVVRSLLRRKMIIAVVGGVAAAVGGLLFVQKKPTSNGEALKTNSVPERLVSLSPGVTETILALGRGNLLVAVSDYCTLPEGMSAPRVGTAITPSFEKIATIRPDLILSSKVAGDTLAPLEKLAPTLSLPWLTLEQWLASIQILGSTLDCEQEADHLTKDIKSVLRPAFSPSSPRVLLALDYGNAGANETWFIRRNSIHGVALEAAGGKNAVDRDVTLQPSLSAEALLALDPDAIIVLRSQAQDALLEAQARAHFEKWHPLSAVKNKRIAVISMIDLLTIGPGVLELVPRLKSTLAQLFIDPSATTATEDERR
jgi:ABC-type Fe3+-hydroxamate transport system substrate-binding protein